MFASRSRRALALLAPAAVVTALVSLPMDSASAVPSTTLVINEVYGGGGNAGPPAATFQNDFIEIRNIGTTTVDLSSYSVQYASSTGTSWNADATWAAASPPAATYLVQGGGRRHGSSPARAPTPPATSNLSGTDGKVALVSSPTALTCGADCDSAAGVVDFVGYGTANDFEGTAAPAAHQRGLRDRATAPAPTPTTTATDFTPGQPSDAVQLRRGLHPARPRRRRSPRSRAPATSRRSRRPPVTDVTGVITARGPRGFWMQDPRGADAPGYVDGASSGVYVFTCVGAGSRPPVPARR